MFKVEYQVASHSNGTKHYHFALVTRGDGQALALFRWFGEKTGQGDTYGPAREPNVRAHYHKKISGKTGSRGYAVTDKGGLREIAAATVTSMLEESTDILGHGPNISALRNFMEGIEVDEADDRVKVTFPDQVEREKAEALEKAAAAASAAALTANPEWGQF